MKSEQRVGKVGERIAAQALRMAGVEMVERIGTPVILVATEHPGQFRVIFEETVSGDHRGILTGGRSVLAETKTVMDGNLTWSHLREHQPGRLDEHAKYGGLSLLVWVHQSGVYIMRWPVDGFGPGKGITQSWAKRISIVELTHDDYF